MKRKCIIGCKNYCIVPPQELWINTVDPDINRLYYIDSGKGEYIEEGQRHTFEQGKLYFIPSYAGVSTYTDDTDRVNHAFVNFRLSPPIVSKCVFCLDPSVSPILQTVTELFRELCKKSYNARVDKTPLPPDEEYNHELLSAITVFLTEKAVSASPEKVIKDPVIVMALNLIHTALSEKFTVADIAEKCCMSTDGFIRKFTRYIGETPYSYIKKLKINTALTMRAEGATLDETAEACGYSDSSALLHAIASGKKQFSISSKIR